MDLHEYPVRSVAIAVFAAVAVAMMPWGRLPGPAHPGAGNGSPATVTVADPENGLPTGHRSYPPL